MNARPGAKSTQSDDLERFVLRALAQGRIGFAASQPQDRVTVTLGAQAFQFAESEDFLKSSLRQCLASPPTATDPVADIALYADYSGWHLAHQAAALCVPHQGPPPPDTYLAENGVRAIYNAERNSWDIFDSKNRFGVRLQPGTAGTAVWEMSAPLAYFCKWIADLDHKTMVHAASLTIGGVGALLVGYGGAGKSGTVLGALACGFQSAGDDYTLISATDGYRAHAIYRSVKQDVAGLDRVGLPRPTALNWQNKAVFRPETLLPSAIVDTAPIHVLLAPRLGAKHTRFFPIDPLGVFKTLAFSTIYQHAVDSAQVFKACAALVRDVPCFGMELSDNHTEVSAELAKFLRQLPC